VVLQKVSSTKKLHKWQRGYVLLLLQFRGFVNLQNQANKAKDKGMMTHWWEKRTKTWNKIQEREKCAPKELQVEEFTRTVLKMINKGTPPKQIFEGLGISKERKR